MACSSWMLLARRSRMLGTLHVCNIFLLLLPFAVGARLEIEGSAAAPPTIAFGAGPTRFECMASAGSLSCAANFSTHVVSAHDVRVLGSDMSLADVIGKVSTLESQMLALQQQLNLLTPPMAPSPLPPSPPAAPPDTYTNVGYGYCRAPGDIRMDSVRYDRRTLTECETLCNSHAVCIGLEWRGTSSPTGYCYLQVTFGSAIIANFPGYGATHSGTTSYDATIATSTGLVRDPPENCYRRDV